MGTGYIGREEETHKCNFRERGGERGREEKRERERESWYRKDEAGEVDRAETDGSKP